MLERTALYPQQVRLQAKMVEFHGWEMPLHYGSQLAEHQAVRESVGVFDVSHMTIVDISGPDARRFLRHLLSNDIEQLHTNQGLYSCLCNAHGGIIDDLIVYACGPELYRVVFNSATKQRVLRWLEQQRVGFTLTLQPRKDLSILALQGPHAATYLPSDLAPFACMQHELGFIARTGYTGEDGFEIILPHESACALWAQWIHAGVVPCGLAARDTLRLEAGLLLSGQDMDETTSPLESALAWTVHWEPSSRDFIGRQALSAQQITRQLVGLRLEDKAIMRPGLSVLADNHPIGVITSGSYSPTLGYSIALARIDLPIPMALTVNIRGKLYPVQQGKTRFIPRKRSPNHGKQE
jgi:aminomethyltransferase